MGSTIISGNNCPSINIGPANIQDIICFANGEIEPNVTGGYGTLSYNWAPGGITTEDLLNITYPGTYTITVMDENKCTESASFTINDYTPVVSILDINHVCPGMCNGSITVVASGSVGPYEFSWDTGMNWGTTNTLTGLCEGNYNVWVKDANGCIVVFNYEIQTVIIDPVITTQTDIACYGTATGAVDIDVLSGNPSTFSISPGSFPSITSGIFTGLTSGIYTVTITDNASGCEETISIIINELSSEPITVIVNELINSCPLQNTGLIDLNITGGVSPYNYGGDFTSSTLANVPAGSYDLILTDAVGCVYNQNFIVGEFDQINPTISQTSNPCNGTVTLTANHPVGTYLYDWGAYGMTQSIQVTSTSTYTVTVYDINGCFEQANITISTIPFINIDPSITSLTNVSCEDANDGFISVVDLNGYATEFTISPDPNGVGTSATGVFDNLPAGVYTITLHDPTGPCTEEIEVHIDNLNPPLDVDVIVSHSCPGDCNGQIEVNVNGGDPGCSYPYDIMWYDNLGSPIGTGEILSGLCPGDYTLFIDNCTCSYTETFTTEIVDTQIDFNWVQNPAEQCEVTFTGPTTSVSGNGQVTSWNWDYGDGNVGSGQTTTNLYPSNGLYNVCLTVELQSGSNYCGESVYCEEIVLDCGIVMKQMAMNNNPLELAKIVLVPNPTNGWVSIVGIKDLQCPKSIELYNSIGELI